MWIPKKKFGNHPKRNKKAIAVYKTTEYLFIKMSITQDKL